MNTKRKFFLFMGILAVLSFTAVGCSKDSQKKEEEQITSQEEENQLEKTEEEDKVEENEVEETSHTVTWSGTFYGVDKAPLSNVAIQLKQGEEEANYTTDADGTVSIVGFNTKELTSLTVLGEDQEELGNISLSLTQGDSLSLTKESESTTITIPEDLEELSLEFSLEEDGTLTCELVEEEV